MSDSDTRLTDLRREIDDLDNAIHDLLIRRVEIVENISAVKKQETGGNGAFRGAIRPGREAQIIRRLLARHTGTLSSSVVSRIWRELISALCRLQGPLEVAVCAPEKSVGYWDLARSHYGSATPMTLHHSPQIVLRMVSEGDGVVGMLPAPGSDDESPWWLHLVTSVEDAPKVIARLPFVEDLGSRFEDLSTWAVAKAAPEPSGQDVSLLAVQADEELSRAALRNALTASGFDCEDTTIFSHGSQDAGWTHMVEVNEFVHPDDARLPLVAEHSQNRFKGILTLGAYAVPVTLADTNID